MDIATSSYGPLDRNAEFALIAQAQAGDRKAQGEIVKRYTRAIASVARGWGPEKEDLQQEIAIALLSAVRDFDPSRECGLLTFATMRMQGAARDYSFGNGRVVQIASKAARRAYRAARSAPDASDEQISAATGLTLLTVSSARAAMRFIGEVQVQEESGEETSAHRSIVTADQGPSAEDMLVERDLRARATTAAQTAIAALDERSRKIVQEHYSDDGASLASLGRELGVSRERARQIHDRALAKVRATVLATLEDASTEAETPVLVAPARPVVQVAPMASAPVAQVVEPPPVAVAIVAGLARPERMVTYRRGLPARVAAVARAIGCMRFEMPVCTARPMRASMGRGQLTGGGATELRSSTTGAASAFGAITSWPAISDSTPASWPHVAKPPASRPPKAEAAASCQVLPWMTPSITPRARPSPPASHGSQAFGMGGRPTEASLVLMAGDLTTRTRAPIRSARSRMTGGVLVELFMPSG